MYKNKKIAYVTMAYNEERLIIPTLRGVPHFVDQIYVVDDMSTDKTPDLVKEYSYSIDNRVTHIRHEKNEGPGQVLITGYKTAAKDGYDVIIASGGDHQFDFSEMYLFADAIVEKNIDYAKGNRFLVDAKYVMPLKRYFGNIFLSILTRIASGNHDIFDTQDGYTALTKEVVDTVNWDIVWKGYGYPSDFIIKISGYGFKITDVPRRSIYLPGERQSQIKIKKYIMKVFPMIMRGWIWRIRNYRKLSKWRTNNAN